jgi:RND family efflux transporter MFP subunit
MTRLAAAASLLMFAAAASCGRPSVEEVETTEQVPVSVATARSGTIDSTIDVTGLVAAAPGGDWTIVAPAPARIADLPKGEGEPVKPGELLVRFDIPSLAAEVAQHRAEAAQASARLDTARAAVARLSGLFDRGVAAAREVEDARRDAAEAEAALQQAQSAVTASDALADRATVRATFAGVVAKRWHNPGDLVDASASDPVLRVIDPDALQVLAAVPVAALPRVARGQPARITAPGLEGPVAGRVVARPVQVDPGQPTADVRVAFAHPAGLPAGAAVAVAIVVETRQAAVLIPSAAVVHDGDDTSVFVVGTDNTAHRRAVVPGLTAASRTEIVKGVAAGDRVVVRGQDELPDGAAVTVTTTGDAAAR